MEREKYRQDLDYYCKKMEKSFKKSETVGLEGVIELAVSDETKEETWFIKIQNQNCQITQEKNVSDTKVTMSKALFIDGYMGNTDLMQAFMDRQYKIEGNLELAMSMDFLFEKPKKYNEWFYLLENSHDREKTENTKLIYRFSILDKLIEEDGIQMNEPEYRYRNVIIDHGLCEVLPHNDIPHDVEFIMTETAMMSMIEGELSYYDLFLLKQFDFNGPNKSIFDFPMYFTKEIFKNRSIKHLTVKNVFESMSKMLDEIPPKLLDKIICMNITGKDPGIYYIRILSNTIQIIPKEEVIKINAKITMTSKTFFGFCFNEIDYHSALDESLIQFQGDINVGMNFDSLFKFRFIRDENAENE